MTQQSPWEITRRPRGHLDIDRCQGGRGSRGFGRVLVALAVLLSLLGPTSPRASDGEVKESLKDFGRKVGEKSKEIGHEVVEVAKKVWYKGKKVSQPLLRDVQKSTRKFWDEVIKGKDRTLEKLRGENEKLHRDLDEEGED